MQFGDTLDNMVDGRRKNLRETEYRRIACACIISANKHSTMIRLVLHLTRIVNGTMCAKLRSIDELPQE